MGSESYLGLLDFFFWVTKKNSNKSVTAARKIPTMAVLWDLRNRNQPTQLQTVAAQTLPSQPDLQTAPSYPPQWHKEMLFLPEKDVRVGSAVLIYSVLRHWNTPSPSKIFLLETMTYNILIISCNYWPSWTFNRRMKTLNHLHRIDIFSFFISSMQKTSKTDCFHLEDIGDDSFGTDVSISDRSRT